MDGSVLFLSPPGITISAVEIQIPRSGPFSPLCSFPSDSSLSLFTTFPQLPSLPPTRVFSLSSQKPPLTVFTRHCLHWPRAQHTLDTRTVNRVCLPLKRVALLLAQLLFCPTSTVLKCFGVVWVKLELGNNFSGFGFCSLTFVVSLIIPGWMRMMMKGWISMQLITLRKLQPWLTCAFSFTSCLFDKDS